MKSEANVEDLRNKVVSDGTMRPEDLIPKFLGVLKEYAPDRYDAYVKENPEVLDLKGMDDETLGFVVEELFDELDKIAPEGCIFGATDGDGACYGFWDPEASESRKCSERSNDDYLQEVYDELVAVWDKDKFDMTKGYDDYYECNSIKITPKDAEGFVATIYVDDFEGRHPVGFDVVYHYPGDKGVGVMGSYEFQSTNLDEVAPEIFDYFDDLKERAAAKERKSESKKNEETILFKDTEIPNELKQVYNACKKRFYCEPNLVSMVDSSDNGYYKMDGSFGSYVKIRIEVERKDGKFIVSVDGLDETTGYHWETLGTGESENIKQATDTAMAEVDKNLMPFATKIHKAIKGESKSIDDKVIPDEQDFEKCPHCGSHNTDIRYEVDLWKPADVLAYATCKDCGKEYHGQFVFMGAYYGKDGHDYDPIDTCPFCGSKEHTETVQFDGGGYVDQDFKCKSCGETWYNSFAWSDTQSAFECHTHKSEESKKSEGLPPKRLGSKRQYRSRADLINKMKQLGAVEITTSKQFNDIKNSQWLHTAGYALDTNGNLVAQSYYGDKDGKWYYTSTRNFDSDYLPESKSDGERAVDDYDTLIDGLKELGFEPSSNVRNGKIYPYRTRFTATKDGIKYGFTLNEDRTGEYLESIEVGGGIFDKGDPNDPDTTKFNSVGDLLDALKKTDGKESESKKSEASRDFIPKADNGKYDVHISIYGKNGKLLYKADYTAETSTTYKYNVKGALDDYNSNRARVLKRSPEKADEWVEPYRIVIMTAPDGENTDRVYDTKLHWLKDADWRKPVESVEPKKSESLTLKQKELKDMVRYGEAEDITTLPEPEAKELYKKGLETVGLSRGTYGLNGALLRDSEGKKYAITARSSNLFYFI